MRLLRLLLPLFLVPGLVRSDVVINELQSSNASTLLDEDGDASDWIELLNRGTETVDLAGWGLSDRADNPWKWTFPSIVLAPGQHLLVWASGKDRGSAEENPPPPYDSPADIPGLVLWLNAEETNYTDGDSVEVWPDQSGHDNDAVASFFWTSPVFRENRVNGRPAIEFVRPFGHELRLPTADFDGMENFNDFSLFTIARWQGTATSGIFGTWDGAGNDGNIHFEVNGSGELRLRVSALDSVRAGGALSIGEWAVLGSVMQGTGDTPIARLFKNGQEIGSRAQSAGTAWLANYGNLLIGNSHENRRFNGDIAEFLIYNRSLTAEERGFVEKYLADRYGLGTPPVVAALHTNFAIGAEGETIVLTRPDGGAADLVPPVAIPRDTSYGRSPDGGETLAFFTTSTPGAANTTTAYGPPLAPPALSQPRGFQDEPFSLTITHPDPQASIKYTLDGSEPSLTHGESYTGPLQIDSTTVVRAVAVKDGSLPMRALATSSYLFLDDIIHLTERPPGYPANWGSFGQTSYAISSSVASRPGYEETMKAALQSFPTLAISLSPGDMFGAGGVYSNPTVEGLEKVASVEWIAADGSWETQIDAGLRVQGGASRQFSNTPKKSLRLLFKGEYGEGRLRVPVLHDGGTVMTDFNTLVLRAEYNNSWLHWESVQRLRGTNLRDQWMRDSQIAMSGLGSHGNHVHLYINGIYWGVYNPSERPDAAFSASYLGGEREDYDAMTHDGVRDGDNIAWNAMRAIAQGGLTSPAQYAAIQQYLDVDHFIDYMILNIYGGNEDWPHNNWNATRLRQQGAGYRFFAWDAERSLEGPGVNRVNLTGSNNPAEFYAALRQNAEFRLRFADRAHRHFFNGGALTPNACIARYATRAAHVESGVFAEEARWGAYRHEIRDSNGPSPRYTLNPHWLIERDRLINTYFPIRTGTVLSQFRAGNLYPSVNAPSFSQHGGPLEEEDTVSIDVAQGIIYYTLDGDDPRQPVSGAVAAGAIPYTGPLAIAVSATLKARALHNGVWSALNEADFIVGAPEPVFLPTGTADWTNATSWTSPAYPDGAGQWALFNAPDGDRNIDLRSPVTVGQIRFLEAGSPWRDRVRDRNTGNTLTFDGGGENARIIVEGDGTGFVEFEVVAGVVLASDLELQVNHLTGNDEHGALRLRTGWSGPGGLIKTGLGTVSLTGEDKNFAGPLVVERGVLQLTQPSTPAFASSVTVHPGGQLRLVSGGVGETRVYGFGTPLTIAGQGRGPEIPDDSGFGVLGALRYDPGGGTNHAVVTIPVHLAESSSIHVNGGSNLLELAAGLGVGEHPLSKSGGGTLMLGGDNSAFTGPLHIVNGRVWLAGPLGSAVSLAETGILTGHGASGELSGPGTVLLNGAILRSPSLENTTLAVVLNRPGSPLYDQPPQSDNGLLILDQAPQSPGVLRLYLPAPGNIFRGGLFTPFAEDLSASLRETQVEIYVPDLAGSHSFQNQPWSLATDAQAITVPETADFGGGPVQGRIVEIRLGAPPASFATWQLSAFPDESDRNDPDIGGPSADPTGSGISNLLRYALGIGPGDLPADFLPRLALHEEGASFRFPFDPGRDDIVVIVESTADLSQWNESGILFDSRTDFPATLEDGWLRVDDPADGERRFYRLKIQQIPAQ